MKDFGSPETWNMKVDEFLEKKSQASLIEDLAPGPLRDEYLKDFDPTQETYEEYKRRKSIPMEDRPLNMAGGGLGRSPVVPDKSQAANIAKWQKANPKLKFENLSPTQKYIIRETGRETIGCGSGSSSASGEQSKYYQPLSDKEKK